MAAASENNHIPRSSLAALTLGAIGVVYGDIGTSPLYTIKEVFGGTHPIPADTDHVLGVLSLIFWALIFIVSLKYVVFIMRADNRGEGGIMALMALALRSQTRGSKKAWWMTVLGLFGASLFYGDGVITPAISVLSAVEGLEIATPVFKPFVVPLALVVLVGLFLFQRHGTASVGALFGPIMVVWFVTLAVLGVSSIVDHPEVLWAVNPVYAVQFIQIERWYSFLALGAVVLAVTGCEALYADMGHFGRRPIRLAWFLLVLPAVYLNYLGQGALILCNPAAVKSPFYLLAPDWLLYPMVGLATLATIIASQAVISGAFSLTRQAMQLGYSPRLDTQHTSESEIGQIYVPSINWMLLGSVVALVLGFQSSSKLASAYGIAVTGTMLIDTLLAFVVARTLWRWDWFRAVLFLIVFLFIDLSFFSATTVKILDGGWFPLVLGMSVFILLSTWKRGRTMLYEQMRTETMPLEDFIRSLFSYPPHRVEGTAIFMVANPAGVPRSLLHNLLHNKVLHERIVLMTVTTQDIPFVPENDRVRIEQLDFGFYRLWVIYGFKDEPDIPRVMELCAPHGIEFDMMQTSFFLGRETIIPRMRPAMQLWREKLFIWMFRNAGAATAYFKIPPGRVVEIGTQVEL